MFDWLTVGQVCWAIFTVVPGTLLLALLITLSAVGLGIGLTLIQSFRVPVLAPLCRLLVSFLRGTPLLVQLFIVYYLLPAAAGGLMADMPLQEAEVSSLAAVLLTFPLNQAAFQEEYIRGALKSVGFGQLEAAWSAGLTTWQGLRWIVLPQAFVVALPNLFNTYMRSIKGMSLAFLVGAVDILAKAKMESALNFRYLESYVAAGLVYWGLCLLLTWAFRRLDRHLLHAGDARA